MRRMTGMTLTLVLVPAIAEAQRDHQHELHVNPRWKECSFQLDPSLTQDAWHQFTEEAGLVVYFRPLAGAKPMGRGNFEVSMLQWETAIDDSDDAWNNTMVHPDSTHWLFEGNGMKFPGLMVRAGVTDRTDVAIYATKAIGANYGFVGAQVQRSLATGAATPWAAAARASVVTMYGPEDLGFAVYGVDLLASRTVALSRWASVSPYAGVSGYLATAHERTDAVDLDDERVPGAQGMVGAELRLSRARLAAEYNVAKVRSVSLKMGIAM